MKTFNLDCECIGNCTILKIWEWEALEGASGQIEEEQQFYYDFYTSVNKDSSLKWRLSQCYKLLRNKDFYQDGLTFSRKQAEGLRDFLNECLEEK